VQLDGVRGHPLGKIPNARISILFGKVLEATYSIPDNISKKIICLSAVRNLGKYKK
jgi:hypothetical protein